MFGPALLVNPVTEAGAVTRSVYLPAGTSWYDFWTGASLKGGQLTNAAAPIETIPLYVRAGSIVPMGPELQYTGEKPADPIELRIYRGADGTFTLYEDEGDGYAYEKGVYGTIDFRWSDATHDSDDRCASRQLSWHADGAHFQDRCGRISARRRGSCNRDSRQNRALRRQCANRKSRRRLEVGGLRCLVNALIYFRVAHDGLHVLAGLGERNRLHELFDVVEISR